MFNISKAIINIGLLNVPKDFLHLVIFIQMQISGWNEQQAMTVTWFILLCAKQRDDYDHFTIANQKFQKIVLVVKCDFTSCLPLGCHNTGD